MPYITWRILIKRIKAIRYMMKDKTVPKRKKALIIAGIIYLLLPVDLIPPVLFPFGFLDDLVLWIWIIMHLRDTLDTYWMGEKPVDLSRKYKNVIVDTDATVTTDGDEEAAGEAGPDVSGDNPENGESAEAEDAEIKAIEAESIIEETVNAEAAAAEA